MTFGGPRPDALPQESAELRDGMRRMSTLRPYCVSNCIVYKSQGSTETHRHEEFWARDGVHSRNLH